MRKSYKGKYQPKNPSKYQGNISDIVYRSMLERNFMVYCDTNPSVKKWSSETIIIPYYDPVAGKKRRYYVDFYIIYENTNGEIKKALIEIKPDSQIREPILPKSGRKTKRYISEVCTYLTNTAKWKAAENWCSNNNSEFKLITEKHIRGH